MMKNMPFKKSNTEGGNVSYGNNVVKSIIKIAAKEISGVSDLCGKGVVCDVIGDTISVDVFIIVNSDESCSDVAYRVQESIKRAVESTTVYKVDLVNVNIMGVTFEK